MSAHAVLLQLTDLHVRTDERRAESVERIRSAVQQALACRPRAVAAVLTGDLVHTGSTDEYELLGELLEPLRAVRLPLLPAVGNHDDRALLRAAFDDVPELTGLGGDPLQYAAQHGPFRVVVLDTQRSGSDAGELCNARMAWLAAQLEAEPDSPTMIAMHHPPCAVGLPAFDDIGLPAPQRLQLAELLAEHAQVVRIMHGHVHRTITSDVAGATVFGCPSVGLPARPDIEPGIPIELVPGPVGFAQHVAIGDSGVLVSHARIVSDPA